MRWGLGLAATLLAATAAFAQASYPDRPIRIMVGFSAGVAPDIT